VSGPHRFGRPVSKADSKNCLLTAVTPANGGTGSSCRGYLGNACLGSIHSFNDRGNTLADADAHGRQAIAASAFLHFMHQGRHHARAAAAERMAQGDGAAVDVELVQIDAQLAQQANTWEANASSIRPDRSARSSSQRASSFLRPGIGPMPM